MSLDARRFPDRIIVPRSAILERDRRTMRQIVTEQERGDSIMARLLGIFAGVAQLMAVLGVYDVMSYGVTQRTQEVGIRMALGARAGDVQRLIVRQGSLLAVVGLVIGLLAFAGARSLAAFLYGVSPFDLPTFAVVVLALGAAALAACYFPRGARVAWIRSLHYATAERIRAVCPDRASGGGRSTLCATAVRGNLTDRCRDHIPQAAERGAQAALPPRSRVPR